MAIGLALILVAAQIDGRVAVQVAQVAVLGDLLGILVVRGQPLRDRPVDSAPVFVIATTLLTRQPQAGFPSAAVLTSSGCQRPLCLCAVVRLARWERRMLE